MTGIRERDGLGRYYNPAPVEMRFWERVNKYGPVHPRLGTRCWLWTGARINGGHGQFGPSGVHVLAHRFSWELLRGQIPDGLFVLHHCDNPPCVNPDHLYVGTRLDNARDMVERNRHGRYNAAKTHCPYGHEYSEANTRIRPDGARACRTCARDWTRAKRQRMAYV